MMKKLLLMSAFFGTVSNSVFAASIQAVRTGAPVVSNSTSGAIYTRIEFPVHVTSLQSDVNGPDLSRKYVLLSNGQVSMPIVSSPCQVMQIGQVALYGGDIDRVMIAVVAPANDQSADCSPAVKQLVESDSLRVTFRTALLGDGSGTDVSPVPLVISR